METINLDCKNFKREFFLHANDQQLKKKLLKFLKNPNHPFCSFKVSLKSLGHFADCFPLEKEILKRELEDSEFRNCRNGYVYSWDPHPRIPESRWFVLSDSRDLALVLSGIKRIMDRISYPGGVVIEKLMYII